MPQLQTLKAKAVYIARLLILLLAILPSFTTFILQLRENAIQHRMRKELDKETLVTITVSEADFRWVEKGKELWLKNRLFDVKSYSFENGTYKFTGLFDEKETSLVKHLQQTQEEDTESNKTLVQLFQLFEAVYDPQGEQNVSYIIISRLYPDYIATFSLKHDPIITPPPRPFVFLVS